MIPVIGTAVVGDAKWIRRLLASVDFPVQNFFIINNSGDSAKAKELDHLVDQGHPMIENLTVSHLPSNLGVAGAWNLIIKCFMRAPYWLIVNDDVAFDPGLLKELWDKAENTDACLIHANEGQFNVGSWDLFLIKEKMVQEYGLFDENLYPAYCEDVDYYMRFIHKPLSRILSCEHSYIHGTEKAGQYEEGARTTQKMDEALKTKLEYSNWRNIEYLTRKWGEGWRMSNPAYEKPFGTLPITYSDFDLEFVRQKHLGF